MARKVRQTTISVENEWGKFLLIVSQKESNHLGKFDETPALAVGGLAELFG
jgi:hypothetical protein